MELDGRDNGRDGMEEYAALTRGSIGQQEYEMEIISGPPIDPYNTREYIPEWFSPVATLSQCTSDGKHYYDEANDFCLEIPEGAIPEGKTITIDIGVALYGPFQYPEGLRPVSPVFWLCVRDNNFSIFSKPVTVTVPHFLYLKNHDNIESLGPSFLKGDHKPNTQQLHIFQKAEGTLSVEPLQMYGVLRTTHFCSLCISCPISKRLAGMEVFCLSAVTPHTFSPTRPSYVYFYITYMLQNCINTVKKQVSELPKHDQKMHNFHFSMYGKHEFLEIVLLQSPPDWDVGLQFKKKVCQK